jgi:hypothetical protein
MRGRSLRDHLSWPIGLDGVWLLAPGFALSAVVLLSPIRPFDYFWALVQGRTTWELGRVARENLFLYTLPEAEPFFNQAWLAQLLLFGGFRWGGHTFNLILLALVLAAALVCCMDAALRRGARPIHVAVAALVSLPLLGLGSGVRSQMFAYPCFALLLRGLLLEAPRLARAPLAGMLAASAFWANTHGSFVLAPAMFAARAAVGTWAQPPGARWAAAREHAVELALVLAATCLNPRGPAVYAYALGLPLSMNAGNQSDVGEWQPLSPLEPLGLVLGVALVAGVVLVVTRPAPRRASGPALLVFFACALLAFVSQRFLAWAALALVLVLPVLSRAEGEAPAGKRRGVTWLNTALIACFALITIGSVPGAPLFERSAARTHLPYAGARALGRETPLRLAEHLQRAGPSGRIFHDQALGGLLEWALAADGARPVAFVDQRFELVPPEIWARYFTIASARPGWQQLLLHYGIGTLLIDERRQRPLIEAIRRAGGWRLVAEEFSYRLYVRAKTEAPSGG